MGEGRIGRMFAPHPVFALSRRYGAGEFGGPWAIETVPTVLIRVKLA
jgi:hypothetical protein